MKKISVITGILFFALNFSIIFEETCFAQKYPVTYPAGQAVVAPTPIYAHQGGYYGLNTSSNCGKGMCGVPTYGQNSCTSCCGNNGISGNRLTCNSGCGGGYGTAPIRGLFHWIWNGNNYYQGVGCSERIIDEWRKTWVTCQQCNVYGENLNAGPNSIGTGYRSRVILGNANSQPQDVQKFLPSGQHINSQQPSPSAAPGTNSPSGSVYPDNTVTYPNSSVQNYYYTQEHGFTPTHNGYHQPTYYQPTSRQTTPPTYHTPSHSGCSSCGKSITVTANTAPIQPSVGTMIPINYPPQQNIIYVPQGNSSQNMISPPASYYTAPGNQKYIPMNNYPATSQNIKYHTSYYPPPYEETKIADRKNTYQLTEENLLQTASVSLQTEPRDSFFSGSKNKSQTVPGYIRAQQHAKKIQTEGNGYTAKDTPDSTYRSAYKNRSDMKNILYQKNSTGTFSQQNSTTAGWIPVTQKTTTENLSQENVPVYPIIQANYVEPVQTVSDGNSILETLPTPKPRPKSTSGTVIQTQESNIPIIHQNNIITQNTPSTESSATNNIMYAEDILHQENPGMIFPENQTVMGNECFPPCEHCGISSCNTCCLAKCPAGCRFGCREFRSPCLFPGLLKFLGCVFSRKPVCNVAIPAGNAQSFTMPSYASTVSGSSDMRNYYVAGNCNRGFFTSTADGAPFNGFFASRCRRMSGYSLPVSDTFYDEYGGYETPEDFEEAQEYALNYASGTADINHFISPAASRIPNRTLSRTDSLLTLATQRILLEDGTEVILEHDQTHQERLAAENHQNAINPVSLSTKTDAANNFPFTHTPTAESGTIQNMENYPIISIQEPQLNLAPGEVLISQQDFPLQPPQNSQEYHTPLSQDAAPEAEEMPHISQKADVTSVSYTKRTETPAAHSSSTHTADAAVWITVDKTDVSSEYLPPLKPACRTR
ncbi:MAG: hypothetical protein Q4C96_03945 [Planctomycetia bacterium]|nr:hypothetical protein [Planctomycetia bacterium]